MQPGQPVAFDNAPCRLRCFDCKTSLRPATSYIRTTADGWDYLCAACYELTDDGKVERPAGFQLHAIAWIDREGFAMVGSFRSSRDAVERDLERHRVNGGLLPDIKYQVIEVPGNVESR